MNCQHIDWNFTEAQAVDPLVPGGRDRHDAEFLVALKIGKTQGDVIDLGSTGDSPVPSGDPPLGTE